MSLPTDKAVTRAMSRARRTESSSFGRQVDEKVIREITSDVARTMPEAMEQGLFDEVRLWNTDVPKGGTPTLIMEHVDGITTIVDRPLWDAFLRRGLE